MRKLAHFVEVFLQSTVTGGRESYNGPTLKTRPTFKEITVSHAVIVSFYHDREYETMLHDGDMRDMTKEQARTWLAQEFEELECVPSNPMGKILLLDMILNVAKYAGEECFENGGEWARNYAIAVAVSLERPAIRVDVANFMVG
jgi:hypothetical protein